MVKNEIFINMKKFIFFILIIMIFSSCYTERRTFVHYHRWNRMNHVHKYYVPKAYRIYEAPSPIYKNRDFR
jgi:hypothetical protein